MGFDNPIHLAFLLILLLLVFGAKRLPEMGRSLGSGMRGFKDALSGEGADTSAPIAEQSPAAAHVLAKSPAPPIPAQAAPVRVVSPVRAHAYDSAARIGDSRPAA